MVIVVGRVGLFQLKKPFKKIWYYLKLEIVQFENIHLCGNRSVKNILSLIL